MNTFLKQNGSEIQDIINNYQLQYGAITMNHPLIVEASKLGYVHIISATQLQWSNKAITEYNEEFLIENNIKVGTQIKVSIPNSTNTYEITKINTIGGFIHLEPVGEVSVDLRSVTFNLLKPFVEVGQVKIL